MRTAASAQCSTGAVGRPQDSGRQLNPGYEVDRAQWRFLWWPISSPCPPPEHAKFKRNVLPIRERSEAAQLGSGKGSRAPGKRGPATKDRCV
jgi:hypothetical protein